MARSFYSGQTHRGRLLIHTAKIEQEKRRFWVKYSIYGLVFPITRQDFKIRTKENSDGSVLDGSKQS